MSLLRFLLIFAAAILTTSGPSRGQDSHSFYANPAAVGPNYSNRIRLGLFRWGQATDGKMFANFYMENNDSRDAKEVEITCSYLVVVPNYPSRPDKLKANLRGAALAWSAFGPQVLSAGKGRNYTAVYFGQLDPISWVRDMSCAPTDVKY